MGPNRFSPRRLDPPAARRGNHGGTATSRRNVPKGNHTRVVLAVLLFAASLSLVGLVRTSLVLQLPGNAVVMRGDDHGFDAPRLREQHPQEQRPPEPTTRNGTAKTGTPRQNKSASASDDPFCRALAPARAEGPLNRTMVHFYVSNSGHLPFLRNALASVRFARLPWKPLVLSLGRGVCRSLERREFDDGVVCLPYLDRLMHQLGRDEPESVRQIRTEGKVVHHANAKNAKNAKNSNTNHTAQLLHTIDRTFYGWGSVEHKFLINSKLYALRDVLNCGYDAFVTDTDVAFRKDPRPFLAIPGIAGDVVAQNDTNRNYELSLNSGLMHWRSTAANLELIEDIITVPPFWWVDQSRVNNRMHNKSTPHTLLGVREFPNGHMFLRHFGELNNESVVAFHANWSEEKDQKIQMLKRMGLWFLEQPRKD